MEVHSFKPVPKPKVLVDVRHGQVGVHLNVSHPTFIMQALRHGALLFLESFINKGAMSLGFSHSSHGESQNGAISPLPIEMVVAA
jgi:hypothetical protein